MATYNYVEDLFVDFVDGCDTLHLNLHQQDISAVASFYSLILTDRELTQAQANYIVKILNKYPSYLLQLNLDSAVLDNPRWKHAFRVIDQSKKITVENTADGLMLCVQQPFVLKEAFEKFCVRQARSLTHLWDAESRVKKYDWYSINPIMVREFASKNSYESSLEFIDLVEQTEDIWNQFSRYEKTAVSVDNTIALVNAADSAKAFFDAHKTNNRNENLLLAKEVGHIYSNSPNSIIETIAKEKTNSFWIQDSQRVVDLFDQIDGKVCVICAREGIKDWVQDFVHSVELRRGSLQGIKVCFRLENSEDPQFNSWIKETGLGGSVSDGKIFIFRERPPKWLLEKNQDVKIVILNGAFPPSSATAQHWLDNHSCVIYTGKLKPSLSKGRHIVEL